MHTGLVRALSTFSKVILKASLERAPKARYLFTKGGGCARLIEGR